MAMVAISDPAQFAGVWNTLDWSVGTGAGVAKLNPGKFLDARPALYAAAGGSVTINEGGPTAQLRYCDIDQFPVNLPQGSGMVAARDPNTTTGPFNTPIFLRFENPVMALGAYVTVKGAHVEAGAPLRAVLWAFTVTSQTWQSVTGDGFADVAPLAVDAAATAPFVGVDGSSEGGVQMVCFDASLTASFDRLLLSSLLWS